MNHDHEYEEYEDDDDYYRDESNDEIHERLSKEDKIFGNGYKTGDGLSDEADYSYSTSISVESSYSNKYLKDIYDSESKLESDFTLDSLFKIVKEDDQISKVLKDALSDSKSSNKIKLSKEQVNFLFNRIEKLTAESKASSIFNSSIYILEVISALSSNEYKKLFDILDTEIQEKLLVELNDKFKFLDGRAHKKRIH